MGGLITHLAGVHLTHARAFGLLASQLPPRSSSTAKTIYFYGFPLITGPRNLYSYMLICAYIFLFLSKMVVVFKRDLQNLYFILPFAVCLVMSLLVSKDFW